MKKLITNYAFDKTAKTVTFNDYGTINLERVLIINNATREVMIYNFADAAKGGTAATNVLTLDYDTSTHANTDKLLIYYDDPDYDIEKSVASGVADSGNPKKVGGKYNATKPTFTDGQRGDLGITSRGAAMVSLFANDSNTGILTFADNTDAVAVSTTANKLAIQSRNTVFNGTTWDRMYGDTTNGVDVDVTRLPALAAGTNNIGDVDVLTLPALVAGTALIGDAGTSRITQTSADALSNTSLGFPANAAGSLVNQQVFPRVFNGTTWDRMRGNTSGVFVVGDLAHDAVDAGNPLKTGGQARTTNPTAVADADRSNFITDKLGKQVVVGSIRDLKGHQATTITSSTAETTIVTAGGAGVFHDVYGLILANTSATATDVTIRDVTGAGTPFNIYVPAGDTRGFMLPESAGIKQGTANSAWTATCITSIASLKVTALFVKNT